MIFKNSFFSIFNYVLQLIVSLGTGIIIARSLGVEGKGNVYLISQIFSFLQLVFCLGFGPSILFNLKNNKITKAKVHFFVLQYLIVIFLGSFLLIEFAATDINGIFGSELDRKLMVLTFGIALLNVISSLFGSELMVSDKGVYQSTLISIVSNLFYLLSVIILLFFFKGGVISVVISMLIAAIIKSSLILFFTFKEDKRFQVPTHNEVVTLTSYGGQFFLNAFFLSSIFRIDVFFLSHSEYISDLGFYSVSINIAELVLIIPSAIGTVLFPHLTGLIRDEQKEKMAQSGRINSFIGLFGSILIAIISYPFIFIVFGKQFLPAFGPLLLLLPGIFAMTLNYSYSNYINSIGKPMIGTMFFAIGLVVNILINYFLIPVYGMWAAAVSSSITYIGITLLFIFYISRVDKISLKEFVLPQKSDIFYVYYKIHKVLKIK
jgi:O-antigen/teichoic acid export membrane protein